jgi:hypothetical protein
VSDIVLTGLRAENPMAFLAALGALSLASDGSDDPVALSWCARSDGSWSPVLHGSQLDTPKQVDKAIRAARQGRDLERELGWDKELMRRSATSTGTPAAKERELRRVSNLMRVSRDDLRRLLEQQLAECTDDEDSRAARMVGACLCELPLRELKNPTQVAVSYTPFRLVPRKGRTIFLKTAREESEEGVDDIHGCLFKPWRYDRNVRSLSWDPGAPVPKRALMAQAPADIGPSGVRGALLLAMRGLAFFPLVTSRAGHNGFAAPPGMPRRRHFVWPIWDEPLSERATRMMLSMPWPQELAAAREEELGATDTQTDRPKAREAKDKLMHTHNQLRAHGVIACYVAPRVRRGDDDEALGWGEPIWNAPAFVDT